MFMIQNKDNNDRRVLLTQIYPFINNNAFFDGFFDINFESFSYRITESQNNSIIETGDLNRFCEKHNCDMNLPDKIDESFYFHRLFQIEVEMPKFSTLIINYEVNKRFLLRENFPYDASKGLLFPSSYVSVLGNGSKFVSFDSTIVTVPFPDFSMPFNVLTLVLIVIHQLFNFIII